ncbi:hypothetical protein [Paraburkholderia sp.]|uniref:hypothetical protein n=1 Tax=Paraburkholderia sp. TaxID=1926495 RepID=UPI0023958555|nr:hypothetical protein [Paraburkholderia sp.]MDE1179481.1 hypothetical protein [Paraburkholderia sp.]
MRIWIDTEFNEFRGELISMALVAESGEEFYEVVGCKNPGPWVKAHVLPILGKAPVGMSQLQSRLHQYLSQFDSIHLIADWPEDIAHFCRALIVGPGERICTPALSMVIRRDLDAVSEIPHNALADARAIRAVHMAKEAK